MEWHYGAGEEGYFALRDGLRVAVLRFAIARQGTPSERIYILALREILQLAFESGFDSEELAATAVDSVRAQNRPRLVPRRRI